MNKLLIRGTGNLAKRFAENTFNGEIIGFIEINKSKDLYMDKLVYDRQAIPKEYDFIIIANKYATEIYEWCLESDIEESKLIFLCGVKQRMGCTDRSILRKILSEVNYTLCGAEFGLTEDTFFKTDVNTYLRLNKRTNFLIQKQYMWPIIVDKYAPVGTIEN